MADISKLREVNSRFVNDFVAVSKLSPNAISSIPSILFLTSTFTLLFQYFHKYTTFFTRWKTRLYKDLLFHWTYFYTTRIWFIFLRLMRYFLDTVSNIVEANNMEEDAKFTNNILYFSVFLLVLSIALIPVLILLVQQVYRRSIPNFLMWVAEDPWVRSEIGTSGHYLERPPMRISIPATAKQNASYRSRRSSSVDNTMLFPIKEDGFFRPCKSMITMNARPIDDLLVD